MLLEGTVSLSGGSLVTDGISILGQAVSFVTSNPILLVPIGLAFASAAIFTVKKIFRK